MATKPFSDKLRMAVERSGKTRYRISLETGIAQSALCRFVHDPNVGLSLANLDRLCEYIGVELVPKAESSNRKRSTKKTKKR